MIINFNAELIQSEKIITLSDEQLENLVDPTYVVSELFYFYKHEISFLNINELMQANLNDPFY